MYFAKDTLTEKSNSKMKILNIFERSKFGAKIQTLSKGLKRPKNDTLFHSVAKLVKH